MIVGLFSSWGMSHFELSAFTNRSPGTQVADPWGTRCGGPGEPRSQNRNLGPPDLWHCIRYWLIPAASGHSPPGAGCAYPLCGAGCGCRENLRQLVSVGRAKAGAVVPAWSRRIAAVVALG